MVHFGHHFRANWTHFGPLLLVFTTNLGARRATLGRLSACLVPRLVPLLLRLNDLAQPVDIRRHHAQGYGTNKAFHAVGPYPGESAMVQIVDR